MSVAVRGSVIRAVRRESILSLDDGAPVIHKPLALLHEAQVKETDDNR